MKHAFNFDFSPNLIRLLGEQLIHDKKIALSELVKNAYDADASEVLVIIRDSEIEIFDNGCGMNLDTIQNTWLKPGVSIKQSNNRDNRTPKYKRYPIGEKGVGRLGCHRLGDSIELVTKTASTKEISLKIEWNSLLEKDTISKLPPIEVLENNDPIYFTNNTSGTRMIIKELKESWDKKELEKISSELTNLVSPFSDLENFNIKLQNNNEIVTNNLKEESKIIKNNALFLFKVEILKGELKDFIYKFQPWKGFEKVEPRTISLEKNKDDIQRMIGEDSKVICIGGESPDYKSLEKNKIGKILFEGFIYDFDNILWNKQGTFPKTKKNKIKEYIKKNGGVRVYRDDFRVFNYGEEGNDILDLDLRRVNRPAGKISSNQIMASVLLERNNSKDLIEKTNREGFIHGDAFFFLKKCLEQAIDLVSDLRMDDKDKLRRVYVSNEQDKVGIEKRIEEMKAVIQKSKLEESEKEKLVKKFDDFSTELSQTKEMLINASQTGISLGFVIHEIEKIIDNLSRNIENNQWEAVKEIFKYLETTIASFKDTIKLDKNSAKIEIKEIIDSAVFNFDARFHFHKIHIAKDISSDIFVRVKKNLIIGALNNLFDNAIYWLDFQKIKNKKIIIKSYNKDKQIHLLVADNGKGFTLDFDSALSPFITGRKDDSSMGLGLHLVDMVMQAHQGFCVQGVFEEENLPDDFKNGAIVKLIFKEDK